MFDKNSISLDDQNVGWCSRKENKMRRIMQKSYVYLIVFSLCLCCIVINKAYALESSNESRLESRMFSPLEIGSHKGLLRNKGYDVNDVNDIKRAASDVDIVVRDRALRFLAHRIRLDAIPTLRQALDDSYPYVRCTAARLLGTLGDRSGLERIRRDMKEFTKDDAEKNLVGMDSSTTQKEKHLDLPLKGMRLIYALWDAQVLAEFGDSSGYELAAQTALENQSAYRRSWAISVLAELGRIDKTTLQAKGYDPEAILLILAESETNKHALDCISSSVMTCMRPDAVVRILEKLKISPHLTDQQRKITESGLRRFKKLLEQEKQGQTEKKEKETIVDNDGVTEKGK